jgi:hypothetical protein
MAIDFSNADILAYNSRNEFFGDNLFRYKSTKSLTVEGNLLSLNNLSGIGPVWTQISGMEISGQDWHAVTINGQGFGSGIIESINFAEGQNDVQKKRYTVNLSIYETGSSNNFVSGTNTFYSGVSWNPFCEIENLNESIDFESEPDRGEYNHNISIKILSSNITGSINAAKAIASGLFLANNLTGFSGQYRSLGNLKSYYTESYDLFSAECTFNKRIEVLANTTGNYTVGKTYTFNRDEDGVVNVSERGEIKALQEPYSPILYSAATTEMANAYTNCSSVFNLYQETNNYPLSTLPLVKGSTVNTVKGTLDYEVIFTNNLNENATYFWNYNHEFSVDRNGIIISSEKGEVIGRGVLGVTKYNAAVAAYDGTIKTAIGTRTSTLHDNFISISNVTVPTPNFRLIKRNESFSEYLGRVAYTYEYGNDSTLGDAPFLKTDIEVGNDYRVPLTRTVLVPGFMEVEQNRGNLTIGHQRVNIGLRGVRGTTITQYLTQAKSLAATYNIGNIDSAQYSFSPTSNQFTLEILWPRFS